MCQIFHPSYVNIDVIYKSFSINSFTSEYEEMHTYCGYGYAKIVCFTRLILAYDSLSK